MVYGQQFLYENKVYLLLYTVGKEFQDCQIQQVEWRLNRTKDMIDRPWNYIETYMTSTPCDKQILITIVKELKFQFPGTDHHSVEFANFVTAYVNSFFYEHEKKAVSFGDEDDSFQNIFQTFTNSGDCEDLAIFLMGLLSYAGYETAFVLWSGDANTDMHATTSVVVKNVPYQATYLEKDSKKYYIVEAVGGGGIKYPPYKVGQRSSVMKGTIDHFTPVAPRVGL